MKETILIIEDDDELRSIIFDLLEFQDFNVISAEDGLQGLDLAQEIHPDLILCDLNMPCLDGYGVLNKLRENSMTAKIPFIFLTSDRSWESRCLAQQLEANDYLTKPVKFSGLLNAIANQLKRLQAV